jgi:hypothetical protein
VDNAHASKPFGTIDTPAQGGTASGNAYVNFGWALTQSSFNIPVDGSTITVLVDGVALGHPAYNQYRSDIANFFPGLANSNGAVGFFYIDTTKLTNGVHTISWVVYDNQGHGDGIGSRYFTVQNPGTENLPAGNEPIDPEPIDSGQAAAPNDSSEHLIEIDELGRIELPVERREDISTSKVTVRLCRSDRASTAAFSIGSPDRDSWGSIRSFSSAPMAHNSGSA